MSIKGLKDFRKAVKEGALSALCMDDPADREAMIARMSELTGRRDALLREALLYYGANWPPEFRQRVEEVLSA
jgi:hypothetical protein